MPVVQKQFDSFHLAIKLDEDDEKANLRDKRDTLLSALKAGLAKDVPAFTSFNQGSYSMHTGVLPLDGNYDIDVGLIFDCKRDKYPDPVDLKKKVRDALDTKGRTVVIRRPCVTVNYMRGDKVDYHVDLAVYVKRDDGLLDLAKGKENSDADHRIWEIADPKGLTAAICGAFSDDDELAQYRRCIRYMKRWRDVKFASGGLRSIALTVAAKNWFVPSTSSAGTYLDLPALLKWVKTMLSNFRTETTEEGMHQRLRIDLPVAPYNDLLGKMTKAQMESFKTALESLRDALQDAHDDLLPEEACKILRRQFGDDFPIPEKSETARTVAAPVIHTGASA